MPVLDASCSFCRKALIVTKERGKEGGAKKKKVCSIIFLEKIHDDWMYHVGESLVMA